MHNVGVSIPNIPRKGCRHAQVAATRCVIQSYNKEFEMVTNYIICSKSKVEISQLSHPEERLVRRGDLLESTLVVSIGASARLLRCDKVSRASQEHATLRRL